MGVLGEEECEERRRFGITEDTDAKLEAMMEKVEMSLAAGTFEVVKERDESEDMWHHRRLRGDITPRKKFISRSYHKPVPRWIDGDPVVPFVQQFLPKSSEYPASAAARTVPKQ